MSSYAVCNGGIAFVLEGEIGIGAPDEDSSCSKDNIELGIDGATGFERNGPNDDDNNSNAYFHQRSDGVGTTVVEEHVVEVGLVGLEGGISLHDAAEHDAEGITNGNGKNGQREGYEA